MTRLLMTGMALYALAGMARAGADLAGEFVTPPDSAKPWVFMWWFDEITPADITQHMEELKAKGVGGVLLFDTSSMPGAPYMSDKWRVLFRHALREADRLGLKMSVNGCVGWPAGGPWITPENSSWALLSSKTVIKGPQPFSGKLVEPIGKGALYADVAVHAYPIPDETSAAGPQVTVGGNPGELAKLLSGNFNTPWNPGADPWIKVDFGGPHLVDWIWIDGGNRVVIEASADGVAFTPVTTWDAQPRNESVYRAVPATTARWFRVGVSGGVRGFALGTRAEVDRVVRLAAKRAITHPSNVTGARLADQVGLVRDELVALPDDRPLRKQDAIDLTAKVSAEGTLNWDVPPGNWNVVRIGRTTTGMSVGGGLLTDYLSPQASEQNYAQGMKPLVGDAGALVGKTFQYFHEDNVEIDRIYCWTPGLLEEFQQRRGYHPAPYLAAMAGEIVENVAITDRFLADVRRTIADCVADNHYGRWAELAHADGMMVRGEAGGEHHPRMLCNDGLMNQGRMDVPVAEFWVNEWWKENQWVPANHHLITTPGWDEAAQNTNAKQAASAGHLYGKPLVASEAFTTALHADCTFRVSGKQPELWDQVTGVQRDLPQFESKDGRTTIPLEFEPYGAMFVVFRKSIQQRDDTTQQRGEVNFPGASQTQELTGPWTIQFDPQWFYPTNGLTGDQAKGLMVFDKLEDWTKRAEPALRNFSGTAVYKKSFSMPAPVAGQRSFLDLGTVKDLAKVRLNGKDLAVVWCPPWRVEITAAAKPGDNALEIEVVNLWPNRLVGDSTLPAAERRTRTGLQIDIVDTSQPVAALVGWISKDLLPSGLLGPVTIRTNAPPATK